MFGGNMPVVLTDKTNKTWAVENPEDGYLHVGWTGTRGTRLEWTLEFLQIRGKQFDKFIEKKREEAKLLKDLGLYDDAYEL
jgi:hypothetical protein